MKNATHKLIILTGLFISLFKTSQSATFYWVGGTGNWSDFANHWATASGGSTFHSSIPSINDDVVIDAQSFTGSGQSLNLDSTFYLCKNMTWTGVTNNPAFEGHGAQLKVYGSLIFDQNMTVNQISLTFSSTQPGNVIDTKGMEIGGCIFNASGSYSLNAPLVCTGNIVIDSASVDANGNNIRCNTMEITYSATLTSGDITITIYGTFFSTIARAVKAFGDVINSDQTTLYFDCDAGEVEATNSSNVFDSIIFTKAGALRHTQANYAYFPQNSFAEYSTVRYAVFDKEAYFMDCTFDTLKAIDIRIAYNMTLTVNDTIIMNSDCNNFGNISIYTPGSPGTATLNLPSGGTWTFQYIKVEGIIANPPTLSATNSIDNGGNTGWFISSFPARKLYWIGGTGNWNDQNHWSLSSGGPSVNCIPNRLDSVYFDANSLAAGDTVYTATNFATAAYLSVSNIPSQTMFYGDRLSIDGSVQIQSATTWRISTLVLTGSSTACVLGSTTPLIFLDVITSGTYTVTTDLTFDILYHETGRMNFSNRDIHARGVNSYPGTTTDMNETHFYLMSYAFTGTQNLFGTTDLTFDQPTSHLYSSGFFRSIEFLYDGVIDSNVTAFTFRNDGQAYIGNNCTLYHMDVRNNLYVHGDILTDTLELNNGGYAVIIDEGRTLTVVNDIFATADCNHFISLESNTPGMQANIVKTISNPVDLDYIQIQDINASGATFTANNSIDAGNNNGWTINGSAARTLYWVGGSGNWTDQAHWSLSSGGAGGNCMPTSSDDVFLDANSGLQDDTLSIDISNASVHSIDMRGVGSNVTLIGTRLSTYSSVYFEPAMNLNLAVLTMNSSTSAELESAGNYLAQIIMGSGGSYTITDDLLCQNLNVLGSSFDMNGHNIKASNVSGNAASSFNLGNVNIDVTNFALAGTVTNTTQTNINMILMAPAFYTYGANFRTPGTFNDINVQYSGANFSSVSFNCRNFIASAYVSLAGMNDSIQKGTFYGDAFLSGNVFFDTLFFNNPGNTVTMSGAQIIGTQLICNSSPGFPIYLKGQPQTTFSKASGDVCLNYVLLENVMSTGGANFYAGLGCTDLGNNTNWQFVSCTNVSDVWPGDANYDLNCDNFDILNIGVAFNQTGPVRAGANISWTAQPAADFSTWFNSAINTKHADCDGNGVVDINDTLAVSLNYTQTHPARLANPNTNINSILPPLVLDATPDTVGPSMAVQVDVLLGSSTQVVDSLYGIAFSINYDPTVVDTNSVTANFAGSWLGTAGADMITFVRHFPTIGKIDVAMVRNDQQNVINGFGNLAVFDVVIVDNISTVTNSLFRLSDVSAITYSQYVQPFARINDTIIVDPTWDNVIQTDLSAYFSVYPNPANSTLFIHATDIKTESIEIYDVAGRLIMRNKVYGNQITVPIDGLAQGVYKLRCNTDKGAYNQMIEVVHR